MTHHLLTTSPSLTDVTPDDLKRFLVSKGWQETQTFGRRGARWGRTAEGHERYVLVPYDRSLDDYPDRIRELVNAVATVESRTPTLTAEELTHVGSDIVHIAVPSDPLDDSLSLETGARLVTAAKDLVLSGALVAAAAEPQPAFGRGRRPQQASDFMERMRLAQPNRGSFVVTLAAPVERYLDADEEGGGSAPFARRALETLARSLTVAVERASESPEHVAAEEAISAGVNANLLTAVSAMLGDSEHPSDVRIDFSWSPSVPSPAEAPRRVDVPGASRVTLRDAAELLRSRAPLYDRTVEGPVTTLTKEGPRFGKATLKTVLGDALRFVEVELNESAYNQAIEAHRHDLYVRVNGDIERTGQRWRIREPAQFSVLAESAEANWVPQLDSPQER